MTKITLDRAVAEQALHVASGAGYPVALIAALKAALAEPVQLKEHCLWARNGNEPCPHVQQAEPVQEPDYWQEEARRYAGNADYWRKRYEALVEPEPPIGKASTDVGVPVFVVKKAEPQKPQEHLLQQALEALLMMRNRYGEYACPACAHADAAVYALKDALAEEALQRLTDVSQEIEAALAAPQKPRNKSCAPGYCYCEPVQEPDA